MKEKTTTNLDFMQYKINTILSGNSITSLPQLLNDLDSYIDDIRERENIKA